MNREQRRAQKKAQRGQPKPKHPQYLRMTKEQRMDALVKNGITIKDLEENYNKGYEAGFAVASGPVIKTCYAAVCLALNELHGFGMKRCKDVLNLVDEKILFSITSMEAIEEVWQKIGLQIDFNEVVSDRITEREDKNDAKSQ